MAAPNVVLPPMAKVSLISIWMETVLYGCNSVIYGLCMYLLLRRKSEVSSRRVLIFTSTLLFILATIFVAASLQQLLDAFIYMPSDVPNYPTLYFLDYLKPLRTLKDVVYVALTFLQDIVLIWRLYIVYNRDWRLVLFFGFLDVACIAIAYADAILFAIPSSNPKILIPLTITSWSLDLIVNVAVTLAIAGRLWWMGRNAAPIRTDRSGSNPYSYPIQIIVESGLIFSGATIIMLGLYEYHGGGPFPYALASLDVGSQLAVLTPLLIIVRAGAYQEDIRSATSRTVQSSHGVESRIGLSPRVAVERSVEFHTSSPAYWPKGLYDDVEV